MTESLVCQLHGSFIFLSFNKYGSNVVERCLRVAGENHSMRIIIELLNSPDAPRLLGDPYGNYVIQSALIVSKVSSFAYVSIYALEIHVENVFLKLFTFFFCNSRVLLIKLWWISLRNIIR